MAKQKRLSKATIDALTTEMAKPHITASASKAMRSQASQHRKLVLVTAFYGYECSHCKCRFPESALPKGASMTARVAVRQCQREFSEHICPL